MENIMEKITTDRNPWHENENDMTFFNDHYSLFISNDDDGEGVSFVINDNEVAEMIYQNNIGMSIDKKILFDFLTGPEEEHEPSEFNEDECDFYLDKYKMVFMFKKNDDRFRETFVFKLGQFEKLKTKIIEWSE